jgi:hypothetical protein
MRRTAYHREHWAICRFLAAMADELTYPLHLRKNESPDYLLTLGELKVGVEVSEATSEEFNEYLTMADREFSGAILEAAHFRYGAPRRSAEELRALLRQRRCTSAGWSGNAPEREWASFVNDAVASKVSRYAGKQDKWPAEKWLVVNDNTPASWASLDRQEAVEQLFAVLMQAWVSAFNRLYIEVNGSILSVGNGEAIARPIPPLWRPVQ